MIELTFTTTIHTPRIEENTRGAEALDAVVVSIHDIDCTVRCHRNIIRKTKLSIATATYTPTVEESSSGTKLLNTMIAPIRYVDRVIRSYRHASRNVELSIIITCCSPHSQKFTVCTIVLDAIDGSVCYIYRTVGSYCQVYRVLDPHPPNIEKGSCHAETLDAVIATICHVDFAIRCNRYIIRIPELPVTSTPVT
jgi:hypothetical protein